MRSGMSGLRRALHTFITSVRASNSRRSNCDSNCAGKSATINFSSISTTSRPEALLGLVGVSVPSPSRSRIKPKMVCNCLCTSSDTLRTSCGDPRVVSSAIRHRRSWALAGRKLSCLATSSSTSSVSFFKGSKPGARRCDKHQRFVPLSKSPPCDGLCKRGNKSCGRMARPTPPALGENNGIAAATRRPGRRGQGAGDGLSRRLQAEVRTGVLCAAR
mmetsp:Transcript_62813/g.180694  ORF Transcript_62813/g.180694 Transcript_62813/m.180694 type:complete len:217 (+) Transcript_62813:867-1517(+)